MKIHTEPDVYIIIINWNGIEDTAECVASLAQQTYPSFRIVIVDNASDNTREVERLKAIATDNTHIIASPMNLGFTGGNNLGIQYAIEHGANYVLLLNNDTVVSDPALLAGLVAAAELDPAIGLLSPSIAYYKPEPRLWYAGAALSLWSGWRHRNQLPAALRPVDTGYTSGCCVLARVEMISAIGKLDERYFLSVEDVEWALRARRANWRVVYVPQLSIRHKASASTRDHHTGGTYSPIRIYYEQRNTIWLIRQYGNRLQRYGVWPLRLVIRWLYYIAGYITLRRWSKFRALLRAIHDGIVDYPEPKQLLDSSAAL